MTVVKKDVYLSNKNKEMNKIILKVGDKATLQKLKFKENNGKSITITHVKHQDEFIATCDKGLSYQVKRINLHKFLPC